MVRGSTRQQELKTSLLVFNQRCFFVSAQLENDSTSIQIVFIIPMLVMMMMKLNSLFLSMLLVRNFAATKKK